MLSTILRKSAQLGAAFALFASAGSATAGNFSVVHSFSGTDGAHPYAGVVWDKDRNLVGTTNIGGQGCAPYGCGVVYKLAPDGTQTVLYYFQGGNDGARPHADSLVMDKSGNFYGTTHSGGNTGCGGNGCGTVFKLAPDGTETILHVFTGGKDGGTPYSGLAIDEKGNLYGTGYVGGDLTCNAPTGCGNIYKISAKGKFSVLYGFKAGADGAAPEGAPAIGSDGNIYGTTLLGGTGSCQNSLYIMGCGVVFQVTPKGDYKVIYTFKNTQDGDFPQSAPVMGSDGNLYGTTYLGGPAACNCGTIYKLSLDGTKTILHSFNGGDDGVFPYSGVLFGLDGNIYGSTNAGGAHCQRGACGTVFRMTPEGQLTTLHVLDGKGDGEFIDSALVFDRAQKYLYGTGVFSGSSSCTQGCGTIFRVKAN